LSCPAVTAPEETRRRHSVPLRRLSMKLGVVIAASLLMALLFVPGRASAKKLDEFQKKELQAMRQERKDQKAELQEEQREEQEQGYERQREQRSRKNGDGDVDDDLDGGGGPEE
jgi:uncharacterized membrane protein YgaE (UPF0421/DUF939 family)